MIKEKEPISGKENKRLTALNSYNVLDTLPEKEFDAITRLASYICQTPIALISLVDVDRQWFKSRIGLKEHQTPLVDSFCHHAIDHDQMMEVPDAELDERFKDNRYVKGDPHIRFYAGAPLMDPDGHRLGSLCVIDSVPRQLTPEQRDALHTLADEVMSHFVLRKQKRELEQSLNAHKDFYTLFNSSADIHLIADRESKIELISDAVYTILGYTPHEAHGNVLWDFVVGKKKDEKHIPIIERGLASQQAFELETQIMAASGDIKWISWSVIHKNRKWYASGRDITLQKELDAERELLSTVASKIHNGVIISNADDEVLWINKGFEKISGYSLDEMANISLRDTIKAEPSPQSRERYEQAVKNNESYEADLLIHKKDGKPIWVSVINSVLLDAEGKIEKHIRIVVDITSRKSSERDLQILSFAARKSPIGMVIRDTEGYITWLNDAMLNIIGYTAADLKGKKFVNTLVGPETDLSVFDGAVKAVQDKKPYNIEIKLYKKDGTPMWVSVQNSPLINDTGEIERQVGTMIDITERKNAEEQLKMLSLVASNTTSGVVINDSNGKVEWVNNAFESITGYNINDIKDKPLGDTLRGELTDVSIIQRSRELSKNKQSFEVDLLAYRKDGQPLWVSVINSVIVNSEGKVEKYIEVIIDITAKKKVELELITAKEEALQLNRAKDMFISVMSHEIRTPLNAIIGLSGLLLDESPNDSQKEHLSVLKFSSENLLTLINDVLDFTKIETGNIELEKANVNLRELVRGITSTMQYNATEKGVAIRSKIDDAVPDAVIGDSARLVQILLNLVSNSVKFTDKGSIDIELKVLEESDKSVRIRFAVTDTGIGIAKDKLGTIFESFKQAEADTTRKYGGTGLGLAISKRLVELHESRINVDSVRGQGSTFWFTITFNRADNRKSINSNIMEIGLHIKVLVVDDNQINRMLVNKVLAKWGVSADFAENGIEAVSKIENNKYDVVLMDIHMPLMGGIEATQIVRSKPEDYYQQLPIIALTASMLSSEINSISHSGMNDFILKPFEPKTLYDKLSKYQK